MKSSHYLIVIGASLFNAILLAMIKWMLNSKMSVISCFLLLQAAYIFSALVIMLGAFVYDAKLFTNISQDVCRAMTLRHLVVFVAAALLSLLFTGKYYCSKCHINDVSYNLYYLLKKCSKILTLDKKLNHNF